MSRQLFLYWHKIRSPISRGDCIVNPDTDFPAWPPILTNEVGFHSHQHQHNHRHQVGDIVLPTGEENNRQITVAQDQAREIFNHHCIYHHHWHDHPNSWGSGERPRRHLVCYISGNLSHRWKPKMTLLLTLRQPTSPLWVWAASPPASRLLGRSCRGDPSGWPDIQGTLIISAGNPCNRPGL